MQMQVTVPTSRPTQPGKPWVIRYSIGEDSAVFPWRLPATPLLREVTVVCANVSDLGGIGMLLLPLIDQGKADLMGGVVLVQFSPRHTNQNSSVTFVKLKRRFQAVLNKVCRL